MEHWISHMSGNGYSNYYGSGHGDGDGPEIGPPMDALSRAARERKRAETLRQQRAREFSLALGQALRQAQCTCGHDQLKHEDGRGACTDWYDKTAGPDARCWCEDFESRFPQVPPEWRQAQ